MPSIAHDTTKQHKPTQNWDVFMVITGRYEVIWNKIESEQEKSCIACSSYENQCLRVKCLQTKFWVRKRLLIENKY